MKLLLPAKAFDAAQTWFAALPWKTREKGIVYFRDGHVESITSDGRGSFIAQVRGAELYEAELHFSHGEWTGFCACPVEEDCKHCCAALHALLARSEPEPEKTAERKAADEKEQPARRRKAATFREFVEKRLKRKLLAKEVALIRSVEQIFRIYGTHERVPEFALAPLLGRDAALSWERVAVWPSPPHDVWESWLYLAHFLHKRGRPAPPLLEAITPWEEVEALVGDWERQQQIALWSQRLAEVAREESGEPPPALELRVAFEEKGGALEARRGADEPWALVKKSLFGEMRLAADAGLLPFADDVSALVWAAFCKGDDEANTLDYRAPDARPALQELLRNPLLAQRVFTAAREPFRRAPERLVWHLEPADDDYTLTLTRPDGTLPPPAIVALDGAPALHVTADTIYEAPPLGGLSIESNRIPAPALESPDGVALLDRIGLALPPRLERRVERRRARLVVEARLCFPSDAKGEYLALTVRGDWGESAPAETLTPQGWEAADHEAPAPEGRGVILRLDRGPLRPAPALVTGLNASWNFREQAWLRRVTKKFPGEFSDWLAALPPEAELRLDPALASLRDAPLSARVKIDVEPVGVDWFDLRVALDLPDLEFTPEELRTLLNARGGWVRLGAKGWRRLALAISDEEDRSLAELGLSPADLASPEPQRLHALQLAHESAAHMLPAERAAEVRRRVSEIQARVTPAVPAAITAELRPYQVEGFHFLAYLAANRFGGVLADDMGLGKTLQTLAWLVWLRAQPGHADTPSLVVCPKSVMDNWRAEAARFLPGFRVRLWRAGETDKLADAARGCDLLVLNYTQLRLLAGALKPIAWHCVILDEAQAIKNPDSQTSHAACALQSPHRLALTGTPIENRLLDLWSIMAFAMPGVLGNRARFSKLYDTKEDPLARRRLAARVRPFLLRRTKEQVARDLPARIEEELLCELEGKQATLYSAELKRARQELLKLNTPRELDKARFHILTSLLRLRQICCHAALVDPASSKAPSAKLDALLELLEPLVEEGRKVLVFSQFVTMIHLVRDAVAARGWPVFVLTGETEDRGALVTDFQASEGGAVFLLSLKAGGFGLNLTAASDVVLFDPWWNPAVENQAIDRTHRIGQTSTVFAYRLLVKGSVEEKIRALQKTKRAMADDILGEEAFARGLTLDDLRFLFEEG